MTLQDMITSILAQASGMSIDISDGLSVGGGAISMSVVAMYIRHFQGVLRELNMRLVELEKTSNDLNTRIQVSRSETERVRDVVNVRFDALAGVVGEIRKDVERSLPTR